MFSMSWVIGWYKKLNIFDQIIVSLFYAMVITSVVAFAKWYMIDQSPLKINYVHPKFLLHPVSDVESITSYSEIDEVVREQIVYVYMDFCVRKSMDSEFRRYFIDGLVYTMPVSNPLNEVGCHKKSIAVPIAKGLVSGKYEYRSELITKVNPLKTTIDKFPPIQFEVVGFPEIK